MEAGLSPILLKAAGEAAKPIARKIAHPTVRVRVAWTVARQARKRGIRIRSVTLRRWLARPDVQQQLETGNASMVSSAVRYLTWVLPGDDEQRTRDAETVLLLTLAAFLRAQDPTTATALAHEWQVEHTRVEGRNTRSQVQVVEQSILGTLSTSRQFTEQVRALHPWRREQAIALGDSWPMIEQVVHAITATNDRGALLRQWAEQLPNWYADAPAEVVCWLGELAGDHGQESAAAQFVADGLDRGAFPAGYWQARRAIYLYAEDVSMAEHILETAADRHPLASCLLAWHRQSLQEAVDALSIWRPESAGDRSLKLLILARLTVAIGDLNEGIALALQAAEIESASGAALQSAKLLLSRARSGQTIHRLTDAEQAATLAIRTRNARRIWLGDSVAAALIAVNAAVLAGNYTRAWSLSQPQPEGDATETEAADPRLRRESARLAALTGRFEQARAVAEGVADPFTDAEIAALELTAHGSSAEAIAAWKAALSLASDDAEILVSAMSLAELGAAVSNLGDLEQRHPETVREIRVVQRAMTEGTDLEALRAGAGESLVLTLKLADRHTDRAEPRMAADVLKAGAERWNHPQLMLMAARRYEEAHDLRIARTTAESALAMGGSGWAGEFDARALLFQVHAGAGDWDEATQQARSLVTLDPHDPDARWALAHSLVRRGDLSAAWNALTPGGDPVSPRDPHDAKTWIVLGARYSTSTQFVPHALATMRRWSDDEQLVGMFIANLYTGLQRDALKPTADDLAALHAATADYTEQFPDSTVFRAVTTSNGDPLAPLLTELQKRHESLEDIDQQVRDGRLPLGLLAEAAGCSYAEASLRRAAGFVYCHDPGRDCQGRTAVTAALDRTVVLDTTTAHTLTLFDAEVRARLIGVFGQIVATDPAYRDAMRGHEALGLRSTLTVGWDPATGRGRTTTIEQSAADQLAERAEQLCEILRGLTRRPWSDLKSFQDWPSGSDWLSSVDMAAAQELPFWCDDTVLRALAASRGVATFDTVDLLRQLASEERLEPGLLTVVEATLLFNYYADLGFDRGALEFAATMDAWRPRGAAFAITRPAAWTDPEAVMKFALTAVDRCVDALDYLEGWVAAAALGLVRVAPNDDAAETNLRVLLGQCLAQNWMRPDRLPAVLHAVRAARKERPGTGDVLEPVLGATYRSLVAQHGHALAAPLLLCLVASTNEHDRGAAARVILTHQN